MGGFEVKHNIALMVMIYIASFEVIGELQRERLHKSRDIVFSLNGQTRGQFMQVPLSSYTQSVVSGRHLLYGRSRHTLWRLV